MYLYCAWWQRLKTLRPNQPNFQLMEMQLDMLTDTKTCLVVSEKDQPLYTLGTVCLSHSHTVMYSTVIDWLMIIGYWSINLFSVIFFIELARLLSSAFWKILITKCREPCMYVVVMTLLLNPHCKTYLTSHCVGRRHKSAKTTVLSCLHSFPPSPSAHQHHQ